MPVVTDLKPVVTLEQVLRAEGGGRKRKKINPGIQSLYEEVIEQGLQLLEPKLLYEQFPIVKMEEAAVELEGGYRFESRHLRQFIDGATSLLIMCRTIGPKLEARIKEWQETDLMKGFVLDTVGSVATSNLGRLSLQYVETELKKEGLETSVGMAPGQLDWKLSAQEIVFELLKPEQIGVTLNQSFIMTPIKSSTAVVGVGEGLAAKRDAIPCTRCPRRNECNYSKDPDHSDMIVDPGSCPSTESAC